MDLKINPAKLFDSMASTLKILRHMLPFHWYGMLPWQEHYDDDVYLVQKGLT